MGIFFPVFITFLLGFVWGLLLGYALWYKGYLASKNKLPWDDHYQKLFEGQLNAANGHKAALFDAWKTIRGQTKGLQRQARKIKRLRGVKP